MSNIVRIKSTRANRVSFPPVSVTDEEKKAGIKAMEPRTILPATYANGAEPLPSRPSVTIVPGDYWDKVKDNEMVKSYFKPQEGVHGQLEIVESDDKGPAEDATRPQNLPENDDEAKVIINACEDLDRLLEWAGKMPANRSAVLSTISARIAVVEGKANRGESGGAEGGSSTTVESDRGGASGSE